MLRDGRKEELFLYVWCNSILNVYDIFVVFRSYSIVTMAVSTKIWNKGLLEITFSVLHVISIMWAYYCHDSWYSLRINNNNNNNTSTMFMVLSYLKHCESSPWFTRWAQHGARWPPTFGPSRSAWTISPPVGCQLTTLTIAILYHSARKLILILPFHGR